MITVNRHKLPICMTGGKVDCFISHLYMFVFFLEHISYSCRFYNEIAPLKKCTGLFLQGWYGGK